MSDTFSLPDTQFSQRELDRLADFCHEAGMLRHTPRSGFAFLGSGRENVAEHSWRASVIGYVLARMTGADPLRVAALCLFHDLHEVRTGDFNYVNHRYNQCRARDALLDALRGTGINDDVLALTDEFDATQSAEAVLAHDADQLDFVCNLVVERARGNTFAEEWLESALRRLKSAAAQDLAQAVLRVDPNRWWYNDVDKDWWVNRR